MCIYCGTAKYRKIYENHYGPIPNEENGRTFEIHHIDGNHSNNDPDNLKAVTLQEHYDIHYVQKDWFACWKLGIKLNKTPEELSDLSRKTQMERIASGKHHFLGGEMQYRTQKQLVENGTHNLLGGTIQRKSNKDRIENGTHHLLGSEFNNTRVEAGTHHFLGSTINNLRVANGTHPLLKRSDGSSISSDRVKNGTHNLLGPEANRKRIEDGTHHLLGGTLNKQMLAEGTHPSQFKWVCEHCGCNGKGKGNYARYHGDNCKHK